MKLIQLTKGKVAKVDDADYEKLTKVPWHYGGKGYACYSKRNPARGKNDRFLMHRVLTKARKGREVDHINGDPLDNQRHNLRVCSRLQNSRNITVKKANATSTYRGVSLQHVKKKYLYWLAAIKIKRKAIMIGTFKTELHAAMAYDIWSIDAFGEFANPNFPTGIHGGKLSINQANDYTNSGRRERNWSGAGVHLISTMVSRRNGGWSLDPHLRLSNK